MIRFNRTHHGDQGICERVRSHRPPYSFTDPLIAVMCSVEPLRSKAVLHIMDGMRQVWHGGPLPQVQGVFYPAGTLYLRTHPVAVDTVELEAVEQKRGKERATSAWRRALPTMPAGKSAWEAPSVRLQYYVTESFTWPPWEGLSTPSMRRMADLNGNFTPPARFIPRLLFAATKHSSAATTEKCTL